MITFGKAVWIRHNMTPTDSFYSSLEAEIGKDQYFGPKNIPGQEYVQDRLMGGGPDFEKLDRNYLEHLYQLWEEMERNRNALIARIQNYVKGEHVVVIKITADMEDKPYRSSGGIPSAIDQIKEALNA